MNNYQKKLKEVTEWINFHGKCCGYDGTFSFSLSEKVHFFKLRNNKAKIIEDAIVKKLIYISSEIERDNKENLALYFTDEDSLVRDFTKWKISQEPSMDKIIESNIKSSILDQTAVIIYTKEKIYQFKEKEKENIDWDSFDYHREDGPAVVLMQGKEEKEERWYKDGLLHREAAPAIVNHIYGTQKWYTYGKLHREDGPAIELGYYLQNDQWYDPTDARIFYNEWYKNGELLNREIIGTWNTSNSEYIDGKFFRY